MDEEEIDYQDEVMEMKVREVKEGIDEVKTMEELSMSE